MAGRKRSEVSVVPSGLDPLGVLGPLGAPVLSVREQESPITVASEIDATIDAMNEGLRAAESKLIALNLGTEAEVRMDNVEDPDDPMTWLAFRKTKDGWKLVFESVDGEQVKSTPVLSAGRDVRIRATARLDELLSVLLKTSRDRLTGLREAVEHLDAFHERIDRESLR
jgi:hypothetical protein